PMTTAVKAKSYRTRNVSARKQLSSPPTATAPIDRDRNREFNHRTVVSVRPEAHPEVSPSDSAYSSDSQVPAWKRGLDVICIVASLPLVLPVMLLIVLWIRLVSRGPALFRQERIGQDGKRFVLYKFRSMRLNCGTGRHETYLRHLVKSDSPMIKLDLLCDERLIPGGCLLRAAGLDELPQLLNVLRGEMSLVGPRPCLPQEYAFFSARQRERFRALPGLTGNWQVNGKNETTFSEMNAMDIDYVREASLLLDLRIMLRTPSALVLQMSQAFQQKLASRRAIGFGETGLASQVLNSFFKGSAR
ncbi:MAG: sugar transferase, partial [Verrucomicrobiaceae bacterium]